MEQYIRKSALTAEIERLKEMEGWCQVGKDTADVYYARGFRLACERIISFIDTLKVKETDLKKTLTGFQNRYAYENSGEWPSAIEIAEYFYELGLNIKE